MAGPWTANFARVESVVDNAFTSVQPNAPQNDLHHESDFAATASQRKAFLYIGQAG